MDIHQHSHDSGQRGARLRSKQRHMPCLAGDIVGLEREGNTNMASSKDGDWDFVFTVAARRYRPIKKAVTISLTITAQTLKSGACGH